MNCVAVLLGPIAGEVMFKQESVDGPILITGEIRNLTPGKKHGIGICTWGDVREVGERFNPLAKNHGAPGDSERKVGSLGNIEADAQGVAKFSIQDKLVTLAGDRNVIGRSFAIYENEDDLKSQPNGNAGDVIAAGVIGIALF